MRFKTIFILFLMFFLRTEASSAAEYIQLPGAVHVYSTVTSGLYSIEDLVLIAKEKGLNVIILTGKSLVAMEYGTFPLRNLVKKKVEKKLKACQAASQQGLSEIVFLQQG